MEPEIENENPENENPEIVIPEEVTPPAPTPTIDYEKLGAVIGNAVKSGEQQPQLTEEQLRKRLNVWEPDETFLAEFSSPETQLKAFAKLRDGLTQQHMTLMKLALEQQKQQFETEYAPIRTAYQEQQVERAFSRFNTQFPQLKDEKLRPFIQQAAAQVAQSSPNLSEKELFAAVADRVAGAIQATNPDFKLTKGGSPGLATTTRGVGGGGGKGTGTGNGAAKPASVASLLVG